MAWLELLPPFASLFRRHDWPSTTSFLAWTGILVNRHRHRQVEQVTHEGRSFFLKKQYRVTWRERFRNAWKGFGWCASAVREAKLLQAARAAGISCPDVAAFGADQRHAFVLLTEATGMAELREVLHQCRRDADRRRLALALAREIAHLHDAGFDHPDLFAKHILVASDGGSYRVCLLDWQRGACRTMSWRQRSRAWAVLDATLHETLASDVCRLRCLRAYLRASNRKDAPPLARLALQVRREAMSLRRQRKIRELAQLPVRAPQQQFVSLHGGNLLIVRSFFEEREATVRDRARWVHVPARARAPHRAALWEMPSLAHVLFRLERFGVPAPRLLAVAQSTGQCRLLLSNEPTTRLPQALQEACIATRARLLADAERIKGQLREAGYELRHGEAWQDQLDVQQLTGAIVVADIESLVETSLSKEEERQWTSSLPPHRS
jgi:tRNA A-37 threonylcarbamoyl transferase component Bud32